MILKRSIFPSKNRGLLKGLVAIWKRANNSKCNQVESTSESSVDLEGEMATLMIQESETETHSLPEQKSQIIK